MPYPKRQARVLVADPPWRFNDTLPGPSKRGAAKNYSMLSQQEVLDFPLPRMAPDSWLFLWRVSAMQEEALAVMRAWGFAPKAELVWVKFAGASENLAFGMGRYVRGAHETCLIGTRGRVQPRHHSQRSVFFAERRAHSEKPEAFYDIVRNMTYAPRVELFAREQRKGFYCYGDELEEDHGRTGSD